MPKCFVAEVTGNHIDTTRYERFKIKKIDKGIKNIQHKLRIPDFILRYMILTAHRTSVFKLILFSNLSYS